MEPEIISRIKSALRAGAGIESACRIAKIDMTALTEAMQQDAMFAGEIVSAIADAELEYLESLRKAAVEKGDWRAAAWWLERKGMGFSKKEENEESGGAVEIVIEKRGRISPQRKCSRHE